MRGDDFDRLFVGDGEAVVAAHHDAIRPDQVLEVLQRLVGVADGVVVKVAQVFGGAELARIGLAALVVAALQAADQVGECAAGMRQHPGDFREAVEHAAENQVAGGDGRLKRVAQEVVQIEFFQALGADDFGRVQEYRQPGRLDGGVDGKEFFIG